MGLDALDYVAIVGFAGIVAATQVLEATLVAAALGGFALSLSTWRLHAGRVWEALGWLAWVAAAVALAFGPAGNALLLTAFLGALLVGVFLLIGGRTGLLRDVWTREAEPVE